MLAAFRDFEAYTAAGGEPLPAPVWLEMARLFENQQRFDRAAEEFQRWSPPDDCTSRS